MTGPKKKPYIHKIAETTVRWKRAKDAPMMIGYARVSMSDQNNHRQVDELVKYGVHPSDIFQDKQSGKTMDRKAWQSCFRDLQSGDLLVIYSLDRLGRKLADLIDIEGQLYKKGVKLKIIAQDIDTSNASGRMIFHILGALAQWEREWNWERTMHGLKSARERGRIGGQPSPFSDADIRKALKKAGSISGAAKIMKCAKITIQRRLNEWKAVEGKTQGRQNRIEMGSELR